MLLDSSDTKDRNLNCWVYKKCGREPGGINVAECGECPASTYSEHDGANGGIFNILYNKYRMK
ncbi:two-CW domain-containing protein [Planctomycetota bacterium]